MIVYKLSRTYCFILYHALKILQVSLNNLGLHGFIKQYSLFEATEAFLLKIKKY